MTIIVDLVGDNYEKLMNEACPSTYDPLYISIKEEVTFNNKPVVLLSFTADVNGDHYPVRKVLTLRNLLMALSSVAIKYKKLIHDRNWPTSDAPKEIEGAHLGVKWRAMFMEQVYICRSEKEHFGIAGSDTEVKELMESMIENG